MLRFLPKSASKRSECYKRRKARQPIIMRALLLSLCDFFHSSPNWIAEHGGEGDVHVDGSLGISENPGFGVEGLGPELLGFGACFGEDAREVLGKPAAGVGHDFGADAFGFDRFSNFVADL